MKLKELKAVQRELAAFVEFFRPELGRSERRHWCGMYLSGLMLDGERKSIDPMAERLDGGDTQSMSQFVNQSPWAFEPVQEKLRDLLVARFKPTAEDSFLILDDTTFPKKGKNSVGVAHQYCGALGKQANCQTLVSWQFASPELHFPLIAEAYLPESWTTDQRRMKRAGVPGRRFQFQEKWRLALEQLKVFRQDIPHEGILCDAGYGQSKEFLHALDELGERFIAQIPASMSFWAADVPTEKKTRRKQGRPKKYETISDGRFKPKQAQKWMKELEGRPEAWRIVVLPLQTKKRIEVAAIRVREVDSDYWKKTGKELWLLIERRQTSDGIEHKYYLSNYPAETAIRKLAVSAHIRWKIEQGYQQLKEELGLDHFEGRSWQGFHHHVTLCFMAYAFLQLTKKRFGKKNAFSSRSPSLPQSTDSDPILPSLSSGNLHAFAGLF